MTVLSVAVVKNCIDRANVLQTSLKMFTVRVSIHILDDRLDRHT